jgi:hypothetical protein
MTLEGLVLNTVSTSEQVFAANRATDLTDLAAKRAAS